LKILLKDICKGSWVVWTSLSIHNYADSAKLCRLAGQALLAGQMG